MSPISSLRGIGAISLPTRADLKAIPRAILDHARLRFPKGDEALRYNVLQKLAYLSVVIAFPAARPRRADDVAGDGRRLSLAGRRSSTAASRRAPSTSSARPASSLFVVVHLVMVLISGVFNNIRSMITGRYRIPEETPSADEPRAPLSRRSITARPRRRRPPAARRMQPRFPQRPACLNVLDKAEDLTEAGAARPARAAPRAGARISAGRDLAALQANGSIDPDDPDYRRRCATASPTGGSRSAAWSNGR